MLQKDLDLIQWWANKWKMCFNPNKCQLNIRVFNIKHSIISQYTIYNEVVQCVPHVTYLGVTIDQHLSQNQHISNISKKTYSVTGFLQRSSCPISVKESCYMTMISSVVEYASPVWSPSTEHNISKLEMVQRRAARFLIMIFLDIHQFQE